MFKSKILSEARPDLVLDWDFSKNTKKPEELILSSDYIVNWKCHKCGYEWDSPLVNRTRNSARCPSCGGGKYLLMLGVNDLESQRPNLMVDWDWDENTKKPNEIRVTSHYRAHWKCHKCGYKWASRLDTRSANGSGCPMCNSGGGSSIADYLLYRLLKYVFGDDVSYKYRLYGFECDVFLSKLNICIEYDGCAYHTGSESIARDLEKDNLWVSKGYSVFRIKERDDSYLEYSIDDYIAYIPHMRHSTFEFCKESFIDILIEWGIIKNNYEIPSEYYLLSMNEISGIIHKPSYDKSVAKALLGCTSGLVWDYDRNKVNPEDLYATSNSKAYFKCRFGHVSDIRIDSVTIYDYNCPYCSVGRQELGINGIRESSYNVYMWIPYLRDKLAINKRQLGVNCVSFNCPFCESEKIAYLSKIVTSGVKPVCTCLSFKHLNINLVILGKYKGRIYYCIQCFDVYYLIVTTWVDCYLSGYKGSIYDLPVNEFLNLGVPDVFLPSRNNINLLPFSKDDVSLLNIKYLTSLTDIKSAINNLVRQKNLILNEQEDIFVSEVKPWNVTLPDDKKINL